MNPDENEIVNDLRKLREDKGISIEQVANKLKLNSDTITKIENSEFSDLGAYIYIRGYINHYAELLEVNSDKYLILIPKDQMQVPLINTRSNNAKTIKFKRQSKSIASYVFGTFIVAAISFSGWFLLKNYQGANARITEVEIVDSTSLEITPQQLNQSEDKDTAIGNNEAVNQFHLSSIIPSTDETQVIETSVEDDENKTDESIDVFDEGANDDANLQSINNPHESIDQLAFEIIISVKQTSWVKVEYLNGENLHNDLVQPGNLILKSDEPIHFRIGNKENVLVSINGDNIDLSEFSKKNIADFNWPIDS